MCSDNYLYMNSLNSVKIQPSPYAYRITIHFLWDNNSLFHTNKLRENKSFRVVIKNVYPIISTKNIKNELQKIDYSVHQIINVLHKSPILFVDLERTETKKDIFNINHIQHTHVNVEEPHKTHDIIQCQNCQEYGHSRPSCAYHPRCVRCGQNHASSDWLNTKILQKHMHCVKTITQQTTDVVICTKSFNVFVI